jgi:FMN reductase
MPNVVLISGSPSNNSKSAIVLRQFGTRFERDGWQVETVMVRDLPPEDLVYGSFSSSKIQEVIRKIQTADVIIISTPVYKASYTGVLKSFLDLLPRDILAEKIVLPIAQGGTLAHLLMIEYALKPVLNELGATYVLAGVYVVDSEVKRLDEHRIELSDEIQERLTRAYNQVNSFTRFQTAK